MLNSILHSGITGQDDRSLTLEANWHLFNWPGRLVQGAAVPYATDRIVNEYPEKPWTYVSLADDQSPFADRNKLIAPVPSLTADELRETLGLNRSQSTDKYPERSPFRPGFARESLAQAFEARQNQNRTIAQANAIANPVLEKLGVDLLGEVKTERSPSVLGAWWALKTLSTEILGFELLRLNRVEILGVEASAAIALEHFKANVDPQKITIEVKDFGDRLLAQVERGVAHKLTQIEIEINRWAEIGQLPICLADGSVDPVLTIAQVTTAIAGIYQLSALAMTLQDFLESSTQAFKLLKTV